MIRRAAGRAVAATAPEGGDRWALTLEAGLAAVLVLAPMPFGAVIPAGRTALEIASFALLLLWVARGIARRNPLPSPSGRAALAGLLALAAVQALPIGARAVSALSPRSLDLRTGVTPAPDVLSEERDLLGTDPAALDAPPTLSIDPGATASALRTGAALAALLLVATTVAASRGLRGIAIAMLGSGAFQALYGVLVLVSGHARIWNVPKVHYLDCATGTFVNRNHFAAFLACALALGFALVLDARSGSKSPERARARVLAFFGAHGSRTLLTALLVAVVLMGLLLSFSRAGIAVGLLGLLLTAVAARRGGLKGGIAATVMIVALAAVPLAQVGSDRLAVRYARASEDLVESGGRAAVWKDTLRMAGAFPLFGAGYGAFASAYPLFRSPEVRLRYDHAHNDAVQALAEGGAIGMALLVVLLWPLGRSLVEASSGRAGILAAGAAAGLLAILLHSLVDFNLHIPANAATAAILAGALQGSSWAGRT
jgi:O-antigen ligase